MPVARESHKFPSISTTASVSIVNDPTLPVSDELLVTLELFMRLFPNSQLDSTTEDKLVLVKLIGIPDYYSDYRIYKVSGIDDCSTGSSLVTFSNNSNFVKFGNLVTVNKCIIQSIAKSDIPVLEKVFVNVPSGIYNILHAAPPASVKSQFTSLYLKGCSGVVNQSDTIRSINGTVVLCEPVIQGLVGDNTKIVLVKDTGNRYDYSVLIDLTDSNEDIDLSQYLSNTMAIDSGLHQASCPKFKVEPLPHRMSAESQNREDIELYMFINNGDISKLGFPFFNGDLVQVNVNRISIIAKLFTLIEPNKSLSPGSIFLSPLLIINLALEVGETINLKKISSSNQKFSDIIPVAKSATISRVASPITMDRTFQQSFLCELKSTFNSQFKVVRKGDLLPVCIDTVLAKILFDVSLPSSNQRRDEPENEPSILPKGNADSVAWFKIVDLSGDTKSGNDLQYIIDLSQTALTSSGVEFVAPPRNDISNWNEYLGLPPLFKYEKWESCASSFSYSQMLRKIIKTGMKTYKSVDLNTTVLLNSLSRGLGKTTLMRNTAAEMGLNLIELDALDFVKPGAELKSIGLLSGKIEKQFVGHPVDNCGGVFHILYLKHVENLCVKTDENEQGANVSTSLSLRVVQTLQEFLNKHKNLALVASCNDIDKLSDIFRQLIKFQIDVPVPNEIERLEIFRHLLQVEAKVPNNERIPEKFEDRVEFENKSGIGHFPIDVRIDVSYQTLALQSAGLTPRDLASIIKKTKQSAAKRLIILAKRLSKDVTKLIKIGNGGRVILLPEDFEKAINEARNQFSDSIGAPRIPDVKWEDIGGLDMVKDEILDTIDLPLKHPELFSSGLKKRSGILFYGPPGTGKTLLAKAIATNFSLNFFSVKGPELLNMYIGESEANVRRVFQKARDAKPCVIFFDELDSVAPKRGNQGDSGGVMDRIVSQLLAELDGMSGGDSGDGVFVVGATNRPDLLDEALLRPGRFDKMLYLGISDTDDKQTKILEALTRKFKLSDDVDLAKIAKNCSFTFTGADFYALCSDSMLNAMTRTANEVDKKIQIFNDQKVVAGDEPISSRWWFDNVAQSEDVDVLVTMQDFSKAQSETVPSVSAEELAHYLRVKENFEGGKKTAQKKDALAANSTFNRDAGQTNELTDGRPSII